MGSCARFVRFAIEWVSEELRFGDSRIDYRGVKETLSYYLDLGQSHVADEELMWAG